MHSRRGTALILWLVVAAVIIAGAFFAVLMFGKSLGINPFGQRESVVTEEIVSESDEVSTIQTELGETSFDGLDRELEETSKDLNAI